MASVCGSSLSLMDAGVPIKRPVAGIAMGLIKEGDDYVVLTDIAGVEDHLGDMDFKVAGTERGITALQMDIKITGVTFDILRDALSRAHEARTFILAKMAEIIQTPREQLSQFAPRIQTIQIDPSQIGMLIGKGGETIRGLSEEFESQIDVNDDGQVLVYSANGDLGDALAEHIRVMMKEVEVGDEYVGKVVKTTTFGAFVELTKEVRRTACCTSQPSRPASAWCPARSCSTAAMRSTCAWSRSIASADASVCAWPRTRRSPASPSRSSPASAPAAVGEALKAPARRWRLAAQRARRRRQRRRP